MQKRRQSIGLFLGLVPALLLGFTHDLAAQAPQRRLLFNNDGTNLFWRDDLSMAMVEKHAAECPDVITTYLLCPNGIQKMMYPSAHEELATRGRLPELVAAGNDPFGVLLERLKQRGFETFITFRMNEVHNVHDPGEPDLSRFWREHPEYRVMRGENPGDWMSQCLDYSLEPVREYSLRLITELIEKYGPDGIELDWMRFPRHLSGDGDEVWTKREHLTDVVARVRETADKAGARLGRRVLVSVRVPTSLAGCRRLGVDIVAWNQRQLMDFVTLAPFLASDFAMPVAEIREALRDRPIPIYAGIEFGYCGKPHRAETLRAAALGLYASGADGIYLFNFPCWRESQMDPPWDWAPSLAAPERLKGHSLAFPLIDGAHRVAGIDLPAPLPMDVAANATATLMLPIPALASAKDNRPISVRLAIEPKEGIEVRFNDVAPDKGFAFPVDALKAGDNTIQIRNLGATSVKITSVVLELTYP